MSKKRRISMAMRAIVVTLFCAVSLIGCLSAGLEREAAGDVYVLERTGTPEACPVSDTQCLEGKFYVECDPDSEAVIETCLAWLAESSWIDALQGII